MRDEEERTKKDDLWKINDWEQQTKDEERKTMDEKLGTRNKDQGTEEQRLIMKEERWR